MDQWKKLWSSLSLRQRISIVAAALIVAAAVMGVTRWKHERDFRPLFTGMSPEDAGAMVERLKETGTEYRISEGGSSVLVPSERLAELRLQMAAAGLPKSGRIGFELFDKTNLGATDFTEQVNYRRALEGELERSIKAISEVEQARVHLTFAKDSVFLESRLPAKASVLVRLRPGARLAPGNVLAVTHLVASAVEGLSPQAVSVVDIHGTLLSRPARSGDSAEPSDELLEYRQRLEKDLLAKINATLEPLLGPEKFRAGVSVECDFTSGEQSEETYDPERSVMVNSQKTEESNVASATAGVPGTASNLPRLPARPGGSGSSVIRRNETITYQSSKTVRRLHLPQGSIKRVSASVLLDHAVRWEGERRVLVPPTAEQLRVIRELVAGVIALTPARGDQLVIETLPFESTLQQPVPPPGVEGPGPGESPTAPDWMLLARRWGPIAGGAVALTMLLVVAAWYMRRARRRKRSVTLPHAVTAPAPDSPGRALPGPAADGDGEKALERSRQAHASRITAARVDTLTRGLKDTVRTDSDLAAKVLRSWLHEG